ncbi:hypothetical protein OSTOST_05103 [Ostertagia ostertagi]
MELPFVAVLSCFSVAYLTSSTKFDGSLRELSEFVKVIFNCGPVLLTEDLVVDYCYSLLLFVTIAIFFCDYVNRLEQSDAVGRTYLLEYLVTELCQPVSITESSDEPPVVELQHAEVSSMHFRDIRGELHTLRDDISKSYTSIFAKVNALVKQEDDSAIGILTSIAERMRIIADVDIGVSFGKNVILPRPDVRGGKPKMQKADLYTRAKIRKEMKSKTQSMEEIRVDPDDILFCSLCFQEDPELPPDMDPEKPDARETQWMRCTECRIWAHAICARGVQFRSCKACKKGKYSIDVYES